MIKDKKIAIIGCGNLGSSILNGLLKNKNIENSNLLVSDRNTQQIQHYSEQGVQISTDNAKAINESDVIIIALKPYNIIKVLQEFKESFQPEKHILVSLASGISLPEVEQVFNNKMPIYRAMPNTAAHVGLSITCISTNCEAEEKNTVVGECFESIGETAFIKEELMDAATVLGACGIAYALRFIRAMVQGGIQIGFDAKTANQIVTQTVKGAAELLIKGGQHPEHEIDKVTTPKGCTIAGLNEMEHNGFSSSLIKGINQSYKQIIE